MDSTYATSANGAVARRSAFRTFGSVLLVLLAILVVAAVSHVAGAALFDALGVGEAGSFLGVAVLMYLSFVLVVVGFLALTDRWDLVRVRGPTRRTVGWAAVAFAGTFAVEQVTVRLVSLLGVPVPLNEANVAVDAHPWLALAMAVVVFVLAGPAEELVFRGFVQGVVREAAGPRVGIVVSAVVFGLFHTLGAVGGVDVLVVYVVFATAAGLVLGYVYERTDDLASVALAHGAHDAVTMLIAWVTLVHLF